MLTLLLFIIFDDDGDRISLPVVLEFVSLVVVVVVVVVGDDDDNDVLLGVGVGVVFSLVFVVVVFVVIYITGGTELSLVLLDVSDIDVIGDALFLVMRTDVGICAG